jgi:hypothetical protein
MYIARILSPWGPRYVLRRTIEVEGVFLAQSILDLGPDPRPWCRGECYAPGLLDAVCQATGTIDHDALDAAFAPFVPRQEPSSRGPWVRRRLTPETEARIQSLHPFDKRRLAFLRTGCTDLGAIHLAHPKLFVRLLAKSRDQLEQEFWQMERILRPEELRSYTFAAFNLQEQFACLTARHAPQALDTEAVDAAFERAICRLGDDEEFWRGVVRPVWGLHPYLRRYACYHYDFQFPADDPWARIVGNFMGSFRRPRPRRPAEMVNTSRAEVLFGIPWSQLRAMTRAELIRLFRRRAKVLHPDAGGNHEDFIEFLNMYRHLATRSKA